MKVLIADKFEKTGIDALTDLGCDITSEPDLTTDTLTAAIARVQPQVLIVRSTKVPAPVLKSAESLCLIVRAGAGYDTIDIEAAGAQGIAVANCPGMNSNAVAELTLGLLIALDRGIVPQAIDLRSGKWDKKGYGKVGRGLRGRTLGLIGAGGVGAIVAHDALALGMHVLYYDVVASPVLDASDDAERVSVEDVFRRSDAVSVHVPLTEATRHIVNEKTLATMQKHAFVINTARGGVVDDKALAAALRNGTIAGAAADVYENEPAATDSAISNELLSLPNFIGTHHVGASTEQAQLAVAEETVRIVRDYKASGDVRNCVNRESLATTAM